MYDKDNRHLILKALLNHEAQQFQNTASQMRMIDLGSTTGSIEINSRPTHLNCELSSGKKIWMAFRYLVTPCCGGSRRRSAVESMDDEGTFDSASLGHTVTGTFYGSRKGRVTLCIQEDSKGPPLLLLEFAMPTYSLVREMSSGMLRIALECEKSPPPFKDGRDGSRSPDLLLEPVWSLFCNGRKVGFAIRRLSSETDRKILNLMQSVSMGAGVIPLIERKVMMPEQEIMYMRARYERACGRSPDSLSLHLINPDGTPGQELSIFLFRS
ncbi:hypothetical protein AXG93_3671s1190 [Marchantia polymorpha subsp. ruderalis]|uniref:Protein MIZU-KUSSEI 1 n=1 Tax=Marchantia polymorpha subsp. ruderalis TaxID=1480154 RepID=A0A176WGP1_MARPO|nr:hypothetical protein AXG93_3671s1190 [Marchantia polymorpha subsp. ruderalis]